MNGNFASRLLTGVVIISVGVVFLLRQMGYVTFDIGDLFSTFWPCILIYFGAVQLLGGRRNGGSSWWGGLLMLIGIVFLGNNLEFFSWSIGDLIPFAIPVVIIIFGLKMIWSPRSKKQAPPDDDWKSYRPFTDDREVPPAPPLHPDPTGKSGDIEDERTENERPQQKTSAKTEYSYGKNASFDGHSNPNSNSNSNAGYEKWKKKKSRSEWGASHKEHVEWWNHNDSSSINRSGFIGDIHMGHDYWELKPLNISHFIGDTVLDLTKAQIPFGETKINISSFIGDVKVYIPNDFEIGVQVVTSALIGDVKILGQHEGGIFTNVKTQSPRYSEADKKIKLIVSTFIGDTRVMKVG
ncbi:cell wall-active antibiotics response protein LiaF [Paenibacillus sp. GCM10027627]|uniref:cell wall-active antibiotics response protein LiaF n=1 Tax=unclassified Paenibacillus TaxID=185978 RepID=UPI00364163AB